MTCDELIARYRDDGEMIDLEIKGQLVVQGRDFSAQAASGRYDQKAGRLVLTGSPSIQRGPHRMTGKRIVVFVDEQRVVVEQAQGRVQLPTGTKGSK